MTENLKNEHAVSLGRMKKGKREKPVSEKKRNSCRQNFEKAREAKKLKHALATSETQKTESNESG